MKSVSLTSSEVRAFEQVPNSPREIPNPEKQSPVAVTLPFDPELRRHNLAALEFWKADLDRREAETQDAAKSVLGRVFGSIDGLGREDGKTYHHDLYAKLTQERGLVEEIRGLLQESRAPSMQEALKLIVEKGPEKFKNRAQEVLKEGNANDYRGGAALGHLVRYASSLKHEAEDQSLYHNLGDTLLHDAEQLGSRDESKAAGAALYRALSFINEDPAKREKTALSEARLEQGQEFAQALWNVAQNIGTDDLVQIAMMAGASLVSSVVRLAAGSKLAQLGITGYKAVAVAAAAESAAEGFILWSRNTILEALRHDTSKVLDPKQLAKSFLTNQVMIGGLKISGGLGSQVTDKLGAFLQKGGEKLSGAAQALLFGLRHSFGAGGMVATTQLNQGLGLSETRGFEESLAHDLFGYAKYGFAQKGFDRVLGKEFAQVREGLRRDIHRQETALIEAGKASAASNPWYRSPVFAPAFAFLGAGGIGGGDSGAKKPEAKVELGASAPDRFDNGDGSVTEFDNGVPVRTLRDGKIVWEARPSQPDGVAAFRATAKNPSSDEGMMHRLIARILGRNDVNTWDKAFQLGQLSRGFKLNQGMTEQLLKALGETGQTSPRGVAALIRDAVLDDGSARLLLKAIGEAKGEAKERKLALESFLVDHAFSESLLGEVLEAIHRLGFFGTQRLASHPAIERIDLDRFIDVLRRLSIDPDSKAKYLFEISSKQGLSEEVGLKLLSALVEFGAHPSLLAKVGTNPTLSRLGFRNFITAIYDIPDVHPWEKIEAMAGLSHPKINDEMAQDLISAIGKVEGHSDTEAMSYGYIGSQGRLRDSTVDGLLSRIDSASAEPLIRAQALMSMVGNRQLSATALGMIVKKFRQIGVTNPEIWSNLEAILKDMGKEHPKLLVALQEAEASAKAADVSTLPPPLSESPEPPLEVEVVQAMDGAGLENAIFKIMASGLKPVQKLQELRDIGTQNALGREGMKKVGEAMRRSGAADGEILAAHALWAKDASLGPAEAELFATMIKNVEGPWRASFAALKVVLENPALSEAGIEKVVDAMRFLIPQGASEISPAPNGLRAEVLIDELSSLRISPKLKAKCLSEFAQRLELTPDGCNRIIEALVEWDADALPDFGRHPSVDQLVFRKIIRLIQSSDRLPEERAYHLRDLASRPDLNDTMIEDLLSGLAGSGASPKVLVSLYGWVGFRSTLSDLAVDRIVNALSRVEADPEDIARGLGILGSNPNLSSSSVSRVSAAILRSGADREVILKQMAVVREAHPEELED